MEGFKLFLESEESKNVKALIAKLPKSHQKLLNGFKIRFTSGNTLPGDDGHVGYIHKDKIVVAAPFLYSRSHVLLHEISHLFWEKGMSKEQKGEWEKLFKKYKKSHQKTLPEEAQSALDQNAEEIFCMVYANYYSKHQNTTYNHPKWMEFIKNLD